MKPRAALIAVGALVLVALAWGAWPGDGGSSTLSPPGPASGSTSLEPGSTDSLSGLPVVAVDDLPPEAETTLRLIDSGGPFPHDEDGAVFANREGLLPDRQHGYYREYTVETPGSPDRGARRIVTGSTDEYYWTEDHYQSFERISR